MSAATMNEVMDACEADLLDRFPLARYPLDHTFVPAGPPGWFLYERKGYLPVGFIGVSAEHSTENFFSLSRGRIAVLDNKGEATVHEAGFSMVTKPGTRRVILVLEEAVLSNYIMTQETEPEAVVASITKAHANPHLTVEERLALAAVRSSMPTSMEFRELL